MSAALVRAFVFAGLAAACAGCKQEMAHQAKLVANGTTEAFPHGMANRPLPDGTVARGAAAWETASRTAPHVTEALLERGHERYDIFCATCHGRTGAGDGMVVQRGFPKPVSFHDPVYLAAPASRFVEAIAHGYGVMYSFEARVPPADRWAIAAYIRALQISQSPVLAQAAGEGAR